MLSSPTFQLMCEEDEDCQLKNKIPIQRKAYVGTRSLGQEDGGTDQDWDIGFGNLKLNHRHLLFDEPQYLPVVGKKDNIGFGPNGLFSENINAKGYSYREVYDDEGQMAEATWYNTSLGEYGLILNNCQD